MFGKDLAADKIAFVERDKKSQAGFDGCGFLIQFMAVERIANFGAQCVTRAQPAGQDAIRLAGFENFLPGAFDGRLFANDFKPVFAGIAGAGNEDAAGLEMKLADLVFFQYPVSKWLFLTR